LTSVNEEKTRRKLIINSLLSNMNEFFKNNDFQQNEEENDLNINKLDSSSSPIKEQYQNSEIKQKFKSLLTNENSVRTSTPRANKTTSKTRQISNEVNEEDDEQQPISDDSLVIALTQFENKKLVEKKATTPVKQFNFATTNNNNRNDEKSFTRFKSDPINTVSSNNDRKRNVVYNHENVRNRVNIYSSSQTNALNNKNNHIQNTNQDDDDDDDVNLLLSNENLLKLIDSKVDNKPTTTNNNHLNDTFNRNLIVKKIPSSSHLQTSSTNKVIQVPTNKCNLKMPRMSSSELMTTTTTNGKSLTNLTNKNFYGSNTATTTQKSTVKYTQEEIEMKRQQALLRLKQNKK
jgi:hypothetical protein